MGEGLETQYGIAAIVGYKSNELECVCVTERNGVRCEVNVT